MSVCVCVGMCIYVHNLCDNWYLTCILLPHINCFKKQNKILKSFSLSYNLWKKMLSCTWKGIRQPQCYHRRIHSGFLNVVIWNTTRSHSQTTEGTSQAIFQTWCMTFRSSNPPPINGAHLQIHSLEIFLLLFFHSFNISNIFFLSNPFNVHIPHFT